MASEAQIKANRRNAKKSTGPKTLVGKNRSRLNNYKHGTRRGSRSFRKRVRWHLKAG